MPRQRALPSLLAVLLAALLLGVLPLATACSSAGEPVRILLVGDSVTQGSAGDWTWRYRLAQHLVEADVAFDFVGPDDGLLDNVTGEQDSHAYADPDFDQDHAARWGMKFVDQDHPIGDLVETYHPDVVVEMLGFNDLAWDHAAPVDVIDHARDFVEDARSADPGVSVVLGGLPQTWFPGVEEYDADLRELAADLDSEDSRVVTAQPVQPYVEDVDTYDPAHPTATGEVKIAAGVADALASLGIGTDYPRPLPVVPNGPRVTAVLSASPGDGEATLRWESPPGATGEAVWRRDATTGEDWTRLPYPVTESPWVAGGLTNGHRYEFRLQAQKGSAVAEGLFSNVVSVVPARQPSGRPGATGRP